MLVSEDIAHLMVNEDHPAPTWEEFKDEVDFFKGYPEFDATDYYDDEDLEEYGDGDYGLEETLNMVMRYDR